MTLLRAAARTMLASYFVINGAKAIKDPRPLVEDAEPVAGAVVPALKRFTPAQVSTRIPEDTATLVRLQGVAQAVGGLALATGVGRRPGALLLAASLVPQTIARHPFWSRSDKELKAADRHAFVKNVALFGGVLIASADTEGKPSLAWRANAGGRALRRRAQRAEKEAQEGVQRGRRAARRQIEQSAKDAKTAAKQAKQEARLAAKDVELKLS